ncbi:MAG: 6,7-dimethyl-8-ribityllumazine synthase [Ichthyobacteriaceae bacterium]|nr:6,7-dimethyl-8-ribityllumazine synthase [Ichthyobacteriaceae bacterium]
MATVNKNLSHYDQATIPNAENMRFGIVVSEWNSEITENLYKGAEQALLENGAKADNIIRWDVPGSFELIYGATLMGERLPVDAIIVLGSIIQGETRHFEFISQAVAQGIKDLNMQIDIPTILGVLTDDTNQQAVDRSGGKHGNKGIECAIAAIKMANLRLKFNDEE